MTAHTVGIIANPISARDIRRVIAKGTNLQLTDRANMVLRILAGLAQGGVKQAVMIPERAGLRTHIERGLHQATLDNITMPAVRWLDMPVTSTAHDTLAATRTMRDMGVAAIVVLGGDGTHRLVVKACGNIAVSGVSSGTNNAFPPLTEPTITGIATGLAVSGSIPPSHAFQANKLLEISVNDTQDIALVDVAIVQERFIGARAVWRPDSIKELFVTFADPSLIGLSSIAGLIQPISRRAPFGLHLTIDKQQAAFNVMAPLAPGLLTPVPISHHCLFEPDKRLIPTSVRGSFALDGERELPFGDDDSVSVTLKHDAFNTVDVPRCMAYAAEYGLLRQPLTQPHHQGEHHE
ncbi:ATP-NAD kinase family protein [Enterovibrio coralii]|uniref:Acetoin catabolism protein X n=1 Tax=Enterovibrio coralii TaxID=294935 RepID=A0A135I4P7_9GAMM|nr:NAD(+)/NADH kinase [Enterovibrio coralii]KXF80420.1 acetoin catabolism protein X [Enterovibrio coralii]